MPGISTTHHIGRGTWEVTHHRDPYTGLLLFDVALVSDELNAALFSGLSAAELDELIHAGQAARQDADVTSRDEPFPDVLPRDCAGVPL